MTDRQQDNEELRNKILDILEECETEESIGYLRIDVFNRSLAADLLVKLFKENTHTDT